MFKIGILYHKHQRINHYLKIIRVLNPFIFSIIKCMEVEMDSIMYEIEKNCGDIRERIRSCRNKSIAELLKKRMCSELSVDCSNKETMNRLENYVDELIVKTFDINGKNKLLEN